MEHEDIKAALDGFRGTVLSRVGDIELQVKGLGKQFTEIEKKAGRPMLGRDGEMSADKAEYKKAFNDYLRKGDARGIESLQQKAMQTNSDPDGGYLIEAEMDAVIDRIAPTVSAMYRLARNVTISTQKWEKLMKTAGMQMRRVANGATGGETTEPKFAQIQIEVFPSEVEPWVHNETLQDAFIDLEADLGAEAGIAFAEGAGAEFITGNGVGKAMGILSYPIVANASYAWGKVGYVVSGKSGAFASVAPADKLINLTTAIKPQYRAGASFLMNDATLAVCRQMKDGSGQYYLWQSDATRPFGGTLLGFPVEIDNNMPDMSAGSYSVAFGNFERGYAIVNRKGSTLIRDNVTSKGITKFNFRRRFGGGIYNFEAIRLLRMATS